MSVQVPLAIDLEGQPTLFDYDARAELFSPRSRKFGRQSVNYRRFDSAARAIRFAIEELPSDLLRGAQLQVDEARYDGPAIRRLYESVGYSKIIH